MRITLWQAAPTASQPTAIAISSGLVEGLNFALQYQGKNEGQNAQDINVGTNNRSSDSDVRFDNGDGFGLSTSYDFGMGISAAAAYNLV